jgi:protein TonB
MRSAQSPVIDFNQMLVASVFFHFFLFTVMMFLPQTQNIVKRIKPAFMVSLIEVPTGPAATPAPPVPESTPPPVPESTPPPVVEKPVPQKSAASKALVSKLNQLAKLEKKVPQKSKKARVVPAPVDKILEGFANDKMKMKAEKKKKRTRKKVAREDLTLKELEFEQLSKKTAASRPKNRPKASSNLFKELEALNQLNKQARVALDNPKVRKSKTGSKAAQLLKELESIKKKNVRIKIDTSKLLSRHSQKFKSEIRNLKMANIQKKAVGPAATGELGDPGADVLSKYVGDVYAKVYANWKDPLGGGDGMVRVSFSVFPRGNIAMPKILKGSGDRKLDNLAVRAIKNAVPLPPFPREIKEPNLPLIFEFTYVPSKN